VLDAAARDGRTTIPVTLRRPVDVAHGGAFSGVLTGGNGRPRQARTTTSSGVGGGVHNITANVSLANVRKTSGVPT
jgi:hypothetical protein